MKRRWPWIILIFIAPPVIYFTRGAGAPPGGGPPPPPPAGNGSNNAVGPVISGLYKKNTEVAFSGWVIKIADDHIEIQYGPKLPYRDWWGEPMRIDIGPETRVLGGVLEVGQLVQITGIYPESGPYFTTNYKGYLPGLEPYPVRRGTIAIIG